MVDVWKELGKAIGSIFKPIFEIPGAIWKSLGDAAGTLMKGFMDATEDLVEVIEPTITGLMPDIFEEATAALGEGSPPEEIKTAVDKFIAELMKMIETESKTESKSLPTGADLAVVQGKLVAGIMGMYAVTHVLSLALDASGPAKAWGFKAAVMDMMYQFKMSDVIGPMIQAPIWAGVITPMRMQARAANPYEVPDARWITGLAARGIIPDDRYKEAMGYQALSAEWADWLAEGEKRLPFFADLKPMVHRGELTVAEARDILARQAFKEEHLDAYEALIPEIPGLSDLRRIAVRESYPGAPPGLRPEDSAAWHYGEMTRWLGKTGYSAYWSEALWGAHWIIPTKSQADDLLHRGEIDEDEHTALLILNDIAPEHIPHLRALSWDLPGAIEARWMFRWGKIGVDELGELLKAGGLKPEWVPRVASAVATNQFLSDIGALETNIKADLRDGLILEPVARVDLLALGYPEAFVEFHIADAVHDREVKYKKARVGTLEDYYQGDIINSDELEAHGKKIIVDATTRGLWLDEQYFKKTGRERSE